MHGSAPGAGGGGRTDGHRTTLPGARGALAWPDVAAVRLGSTLWNTVSVQPSLDPRPPVSPRTRPRRARLVVVLAALVAAVVAGLAPAAAPVEPAGAQAAPVNVSSRTVPAVADPGEDVKVKVRATGCPPGGALVEVYLTSNDGGATSAALMARNEARSTLFFRVKTEVDLPKALEGWYGVRVVCGQFRPARLPMTGTTFRIGVHPNKEMRVPSPQVVEGGSIHIEGDGCTGTNVEYSFSQSGLHSLPFTPQGSIPVNLDGTWAADVVAPIYLSPGKAELRARCGLINQFGDQVWINYGDAAEVDVLRAPVTPPGG